MQLAAEARQEKIDQLMVGAVVNKRKQRGSAPGGNKLEQRKQIETGFSNPYAQQMAMSTKNMKDEMTNEILAPYRDLTVSHISRVLRDFGKNIAPLGVIGHYLNYAGNHLLSYIHQTLKKKVFFPLHKVVSVQLMSNGEILTKVKRQQLEIKVVDNQETIRIIETDQVVMFRSRALVIGNGAQQGLHPELFNWFPDLKPDKTITSDEFLRRDGFLKHVHRLAESRTKKVVIIGGSHSGFSCTWLLLNGPATYYNNNAGILIDQEPSCQRKSIRNCLDCCQCGAVLQHVKKSGGKLPLPGASSNQLASVLSPNKGPLGLNHQQQQAPPLCSCLCLCFGLFDYDDWKFDFSKLPDFQEADIEILYREQIKVFYNKVSDAEKDGYTQFEADKFTKKDGYLYSFSGLRGDAKDLYTKITRGQEKRVKLVQASTVEEQRHYVERADLVIWACGYQTNIIPIKDTDRKRLVLSQKVPNTQFDVDGKCRIMLADGHVLTKTLACGIAYPVRTKDGMMANNPNMKNPRADGFSLYMNFVADTILKTLLPKSKMIKNSIHKIMPKTQSIADAPPPSGGDHTAVPSNFSKKQYQQVLKTRIQQYRQKNDGALPNDPGGLLIAGGNQHMPAISHGKSKNGGGVRPRSGSAAGGFRSENAYVEDQDCCGDASLDEHQSKVIRVLALNNLQHGKNDDEASDGEEIDTLNRKKMSVHQQKIQQLLVHQRASKSVDRGGFILAQSSQQQMPVFVTNLAKSPQILQSKQEKIVKLQGGGGYLGPKNEDLANLMSSSETDQQQVLAMSKQTRSKKIKNAIQPAKSPYNNAKGTFSKVVASSSVQPDNGGSAQIVKSYGVGREILRSSQGANRKLDVMFGKQDQNPGGSFKMGRASQVTFNQKNRNLKGQLETDQPSIYNMQGIDPAQKTIRQPEKGIEFPPIVNPHAQNHYINAQTESAQLIALNQTGERISLLNSISGSGKIYKKTIQDEVKTQLSNPLQNFKSQNAVALTFQTFDAKSNVRSSSIYQLQSASFNQDLLSPLQGDPLIKPSKSRVVNGQGLPPPNSQIMHNDSNFRDRPLSDNMRDTLHYDGEVVEEQNEDFAPNNDLNEHVRQQLKVREKSAKLAKKLKTESPKKRTVIHAPAPNFDSSTPKELTDKRKLVEHVKIDDDEEDLNDRQSAHFGGERLFAENSPSPYENDVFDNPELHDEPEDHHQNHHQHLESQEGEHDGVDEDVSSEGSCRTSVYHRSQQEDASDENNNSKNIKSFAQQLSNSQKSQHGSQNGTHHEDQKTGLESHSSHMTDGAQKSDQNSKFSFQSRIPRLTKPTQKSYAGAAGGDEEYHVIGPIGIGKHHSPPQNNQGKQKKAQIGMTNNQQQSEQKSKNHTHNRFGFADRPKLIHEERTRITPDEVILMNMQQKQKREQEIRTANSTASNGGGAQRRHTTKVNSNAMSNLTAQQNSLGQPQFKMSRKTSDVATTQIKAR